MMTMEQLCGHIIKLVHAPIHIFDTIGNQIAVYVDNGEQQDVIDCDPELRQLLLEKRDPEKPALYFETQQIIYGIVSDDRKTSVLGPCCLGPEEVSAAQYLARRHKLDPTRPYKIYGTTVEHFCEMVIMLLEMLTGKTTTWSKMLYEHFCDDFSEYLMKEKVQEVFQRMRESSAVHNPYSQEQREQEAIRTGDLEALYDSFSETYIGKVGTLSRNPLRNAKYIGVVLTAVSSRSAIAGGMFPEIAFSMSDAYIQRIDSMKSESETYALIRQIEIEYCKAVRQLTEKSGDNQIVKRCKELIFQNLLTRITSQQLAEQLEVSPGYLSRLFLKEEGIKLTDFIAQKKIDVSKDRLRYTEESYAEIALALGFASQSHFGQVFKKWTNLTPKQYREYYSLNIGTDKN